MTLEELRAAAIAEFEAAKAAGTLKLYNIRPGGLTTLNMAALKNKTIEDVKVEYLKSLVQNATWSSRFFRVRIETHWPVSSSVGHGQRSWSTDNDTFISYRGYNVIVFNQAANDYVLINKPIGCKGRSHKIDFSDEESIKRDIRQRLSQIDGNRCSPEFAILIIPFGFLIIAIGVASIIFQ